METIINCYNYSLNKYFKGTLISFEEGPVTVIRLKFDEKEYEGRNEMPFFALVELRKKLESESIFLLLAGCLKNVYPSGMSSTGFYVYKLIWGKQATEKVQILEALPTEETANIATVDEQKDFWSRWLASLG